jgi:hypothetical protein
MSNNQSKLHLFGVTWLLVCALVPTLVQAQTTIRNDFVVAIYSTNGGRWGNWQQPLFCPQGSYASGFALRVEQPLKNKSYFGNVENAVPGLSAIIPTSNPDDTALNNVTLTCSDRQGHKIVSFSSPQSPNWGQMGLETFCSYGAFITGFNLLVEPPQGDGDDTAANSMVATCSNGAVLKPSNGGPWGNWGQYRYCPGGTAVCGMSLKIEPSIGDGDDTSVNDVILHCCGL